MFEGSLVALVTPMKQTPAGDVVVDLDAFDRLLAWHQASGTQGVVIAGTTGESATLHEDEYRQLLARAVECLKGQVAVIAGTGSPSTEEAMEKTRLAASLGADAALVVTPSYNRPSQRGLLAHYQALADAAQIPVMLYNVPSRTAVDLLPETTIALNAHPNIIGIKEAVADAERIQVLIDAGVAVWSGDDPTFVRSLEQGACGVVSVAANIVPQAMANLCAMMSLGQTAEAKTLDQSLHALYAFLGIETNPVPAKWLLAERGRIDSVIRLPLVGLDSRYHEQGRLLIEALESQNLL